MGWEQIFDQPQGSQFAFPASFKAYSKAEPGSINTLNPLSAEATQDSFNKGHNYCFLQILGPEIKIRYLVIKKSTAPRYVNYFSKLRSNNLYETGWFSWEGSGTTKPESTHCLPAIFWKGRSFDRRAEHSESQWHRSSDTF